MIYGENVGVLRAQLGIVLRQHRIQQRIGGAGTHSVPVTTTPAQREAIGNQIRRYRHSILLWCQQAVAANNAGFTRAGSTSRSRLPAEEFRHRLTQSTEGSPGSPSLTELATTQTFELVDTWRQAARAAALGEHDFAAGVEHGPLDHAQSLTVLKDAAEVAKALVVLDQRYKNIPGWQDLPHRVKLEQAADRCARLAGHETTDYSVDLAGWRSPPVLINCRARPGVAGVIQAQTNLLVRLSEFPTALNLKRIFDSQRDLSNQFAVLAADLAPAMSRGWHDRADTYTRLFAEARNVGGILGGGGGAAAEGAFAIQRLRDVASDVSVDEQALHTLDRLCEKIDRRLVHIVDRGISERLYLAKVRLPRIDELDGNIVHGAGALFMPVTPSVQTDFVAILKVHLRSRSERPLAPPGAASSRAEFQRAINHRPAPRGVTRRGPSL